MIYRTGFIGMDGHTGYALGPLPSMNNARLTAAAVSDPDDLEKLRKADAFNPDTALYADYREMLEKESLDIVCVFMPNHRHAECVIAAAEAGAHVYTEKPLAITLEDLQRARAAVESAGVTLTMMLAMRGGGIYQRVRQLVRDGAVGEVAQCTAQKSYKTGNRGGWQIVRETLGGTIPYIGCHALDLIRWTTGLEFVKGAAFHNNVGNPSLGEMENSASIIVLADNGATISTRLDYLRPENAPTWGDDRLRIAGPEGVVEVMNGEVSLMTQTKQKHVVEPAPEVSQFKNLVEHLEGRAPLLVPTEDCYRITEVVLKLRNAADRGVLVDL